METRNIDYYKTKKSIDFNDGFQLESGTKVQFNFSEGQIYNVQVESRNEKRIFWVHSSDLVFYKTIKEKWLKSKIELHNIDLNNKWLEYEKTLQQQKNSRRNSTDSKDVVKREGPKQKKATSTPGKRVGNKKRIPSKAGKKITKRTAIKIPKRGVAKKK